MAKYRRVGAIAAMPLPCPSRHNLAVLIPARRYEPALAPLLDTLRAAGFGALVVVEDGSPAADQPAFAALAQGERVHLLRHAVNLGKGHALKTGINFFLTNLAGFSGLITADADGQHSAADILRVAAALEAAPHRVILGCRNFAGAVPVRSRLGNTLTREVFRIVSGHRVSDTQTGLRAFPTALLPELLQLPGERYEYEMTVLAHLCRSGHVPLEVPIATVYINGNRASHFNPVRDSMRIYFVLLRFYFSSLLSAALDLAGFAVTFWLTQQIWIAVVVGRSSSLLNFVLNRRLVFRNRASVRQSLWRYYLLAAVLAAISYSAIRGLSHWLGWNVLAIKILVESLLSLVSFSVQRTLVFAGNGESHGR